MLFTLLSESAFDPEEIENLPGYFFKTPTDVAINAYCRISLPLDLTIHLPDLHTMIFVNPQHLLDQINFFVLGGMNHHEHILPTVVYLYNPNPHPIYITRGSIVCQGICYNFFQNGVTVAY